MITLLALLAPLSLPARGDTLRVMFWNVENFFDCRSQAAPRYWTRGRLLAKCDGIAKTMLRFADRYGDMPDIVGLAEIENASVLKSLLASALLRKLDYTIVHYESPDHRGIDCALLYRRSRLHLEESFPAHIRDSAGVTLATRDILVARFDSLTVMVNHHPSKIGGKSDRRLAAFSRMEAVADSLLAAGAGRIVSVGDFNDDLWHSGGHGTIKYNGKWEKIDGHFTYGQVSVREDVFDDPPLLTRDKVFGGLKPRRTFVGPKYEGGLSDHLPVALMVTF